MPYPLIIAIDGPSGSGKSTLGRMLARELGKLYIDTGSMYRAVALAVIESSQGRFTSIDPYNIVMERQNAADAKKAQSQFIIYLSNPQRWARYTYGLNNPLLYTDPDGKDVTIYYRPAREGAGRNNQTGVRPSILRFWLRPNNNSSSVK